jgi:hypothetical protein
LHAGAAARLGRLWLPCVPEIHGCAFDAGCWVEKCVSSPVCQSEPSGRQKFQGKQGDARMLESRELYARAGGVSIVKASRTSGARPRRILCAPVDNACRGV